MSQLIWGVYLAGLVVAVYGWGVTGFLVYGAATSLAIVLFRRRLVVALTHLSSRLGLTSQAIAKMPPAIHLSRTAAPTAAAAPIVSALGVCKFVDAGSWTIPELPAIEVSLMVEPNEGLLAAIESAASIGAQLNIHTLATDGRVISVTNSELPTAPTVPPNAKRAQFPRCPPQELVRKALELRLDARARHPTIEEAPRLYEELYAAEIRFRTGGH